MKHVAGFNDGTKCKLAFTRVELAAGEGGGPSSDLTCRFYMAKLHQDEPVYGVHVLLLRGKR